MRIEELDRNLNVETTVTEPDMIWLDAKNSPFSLHGVFYDKNQGCYLRLPQDVANGVSPGVSGLARNTAGGRLRFRTDSPVIAIRAVMKNNPIMSHMPLTGQSGFDLYQKTEEGERYCRSFVPPRGMTEGYSSSLPTNGVLRDYTINFPLYDGVKELYIALKQGSVLEAPTPYRNAVPVVYYGSSITQGGCASRPGNSYEAMISRWLDTDYINLGFSGNGRAEEEMANYLASLSMSAFVCDYDHNAPSPDYLRRTHLPLIRTIRAAHPDLPVVIVSAPDVRLKPEEFLERRQIIRDTYDTLLKEGDRNVYYVDGMTLFEGDMWDSCTVDGCHPNDLGFYRMATKIGDVLSSILKK